MHDELIREAPREFLDLREAALRAVEQGDLATNAELWAQAAAVARCHGLVELERLAECSRSSAKVELGDGVKELPTLRRLLMATSERFVAFLAAYTSARAHELAKDWKKALFYARIASQHASGLPALDQAASLNQLGNLALADSRVDEASQSFEQALAVLPAGHDLDRAFVLDNLGYCWILQQRWYEGFFLLRHARRLHRRSGGPRYEIPNRLALAFAFLEVGRWRSAERQAVSALALAEAAGDRDNVKNALYLAGAAARQAGELDRARGLFGRLDEHYADCRQLVDLMLALDLRQLINLRA